MWTIPQGLIVWAILNFLFGGWGFSSLYDKFLFYPSTTVSDPSQIAGSQCRPFRFRQSNGKEIACLYYKKPTDDGLVLVSHGNAGNISAYWRGYLQYKEAGHSTKLPRLLGFQAAGAAPIVLGHPVENPETIATAIRIGNPASWYSATSAASESGGSITAVTDQEILGAYTFLARQESVFCEAASAASVAGLIKMGVPEGSTVVCVLTGHGLKDPDLAIGQITVPSVVDLDLNVILAEISL